MDALLGAKAASVLVCGFGVGICSSGTDRFVRCLRKRLRPLGASHGKAEDCGVNKLCETSSLFGGSSFNRERCVKVTVQ